MPHNFASRQQYHRRIYNVEMRGRATHQLLNQRTKYIEVSFFQNKPFRKLLPEEKPLTIVNRIGHEVRKSGPIQLSKRKNDYCLSGSEFNHFSVVLQMGD